MRGGDDRGLVSPARLADYLPSRPVSCSPGSEPVVQHYRHPPGVIDLPGLRDDVLVIFLGAPAQIEERSYGLPPERKWVEAGKVSLVPAGQPLLRNLNGKVDAAVIHLSRDAVAAAAEYVFDGRHGAQRLVSQFVRTDEVASRLGRLMLGEATVRLPAVGEMTEALQQAMAIHLVRRYSNLSPAPEAAPVRMSAGRLRHVVDHMQAHLPEPMPLRRLARVAGLSLGQFMRAFKGATGRSPHRYLVDLRLERAREMLDRTDLSVTEVGLCCGFELPSHFSTAFRRAMGMSPRQWRMARRS